MTVTKTKNIFYEEVIHWVSKTNLSNALIAELPSPSPLRNKNSFHPRALLMSPSVASRAGNQGSHNEILAEGRGKCIRQPVPSVAKKRKCHLSHAKADRFIVVTVSVKSENQSKTNHFEK
jgi:hypothetical protein